MYILDDTVRSADVLLLPRRYRRGSLIEASISARVCYEDGTTEYIDNLQLVRTFQSWRLTRAARPQRLKNGEVISVQEWICPEAFASIRMRAIDQARRFEGQR